MVNPWSLYQRSPAFVLGFHGGDEATIERILAGTIEHLARSEGLYEWLGHGIYFWENDPQRGLEWAQTGHAKKKATIPGVIGAIIDPGRCLDLTTRMGLDEVAEAFSILSGAYQSKGIPMPSNVGGTDSFKRELDCQVIETLHRYRNDQGLPRYDSVRAPFPEDLPLYDGAGFRRRNHLQIAVIDKDCIKGYFRPLKNA